MSINPEKLSNFEKSFDTRGGGCVRKCECGRKFYNPDRSWDWEEGELEELEKSGATPLGYTVGTLSFGSEEFVLDCDCWQDKASKIILWLDDNANALAEYLTLEKARKQDEADRSPVVG